MKWNEFYNASRIPSLTDIKDYLGEAEPLWNELTSYIEDTYQIKSEMSFSKCSAQPGWNIKYKKSGKSLCTMYPMEGYFIVLVVVGAKEEVEVEMALQAGQFTPYVKGLIQKPPFSAGGRWLMIEVKDKDVLEDIKLLLGIRVKIKK